LWPSTYSQVAQHAHAPVAEHALVAKHVLVVELSTFLELSSPGMDLQDELCEIPSSLASLKPVVPIRPWALEVSCRCICSPRSTYDRSYKLHQLRRILSARLSPISAAINPKHAYITLLLVSIVVGMYNVACSALKAAQARNPPSDSFGRPNED
jgi:hypothetical protein